MIVTHKRSSRSGFTLVELLVVIAIIIVLVSVGFGAFNSAIKHANIAKCSSNLHQIGVGMLAFAGDNNNNLPESGGVVTYNSTDATTGVYGWTQQLEPYLGPDTKIYQCPDSMNVIPSNKTYSYFNGAHAAISSTGGFASVNLMKMKSPSQHIIAGDIAFSSGFTTTDCDKDDYTQDPAFNGGTTSSLVIPIHIGSVNILFADGHVQNCKYFDSSSMTTVYSGVKTGNIYLQ